MKKIAPLVVLVCALGLAIFTAEGKEKKHHSADLEQHVALAPGELQWGDAPPGFAPGARFAVVAGDPSKTGSYVVRLQVPAGYKIMPHTHPTTENVTVISGTFNIGMGEKFDMAAGKELAAGGFASMPAHMAHFAWATSDAVVQVHGEGPFQINYVNAADDPRNAKK